MWNGKRELLTTEIANQYAVRSKRLNDCGGVSGERRRIRNELMERCGITELEATNILLGRNINEYVRKYEILSGKMVVNLDRNEQKRRKCIQFNEDDEELLLDYYREFLGIEEEDE